jgi:hypothetical protein
LKPKARSELDDFAPVNFFGVGVTTERFLQRDTDRLQSLGVGFERIEQAREFAVPKRNCPLAPRLLPFGKCRDERLSERIGVLGIPRCGVFLKPIPGFSLFAERIKVNVAAVLTHD